MESSTAKPTWLNQLPDHSIFELDEQEYQEWARLNKQSTSTINGQFSGTKPANSTGSPFPQKNSLSGFAFQPSQPPKTAGSTFDLQELKEEYQRSYQGLSCMAVHAQDVFLAVGRQIRYASLSDLKKGVENHGRAAAEEYIDTKQHKVLAIEHIDFDIRRLVVNQEGKLMAIVGDEKIVIAALPKTLRTNPKGVACKSFVLGELYHIDKGPAKIVKVLWHPLSKGFTHVLVMTQDNHLRMYDVGTDVDEPEQVFNFGGQGYTSSTYGFNMENTASFCFGSKYSEWGQLAVYGLSQSGEIFMMCPVMPQTCLLDVCDFDEIRAKMESDEDIVEGDMEQLRFRKQWIRSLVQSAQDHPFSSEVVMVQRPQLKHAVVARQGPFVFNPEPIELEDDYNQAQDILCLETEAAEILAVAHSCGKVDVCIAVDRPMARWETVRKNATITEDENPPVISVYESIDLGLLKVFGVTTSSAAGSYALRETRLSIPNRPALVADTMYGDTFYVYHQTGAHCVSIRPWLEELSQIFEAASHGQATGLESRVKKFYESKVKSSVGCIVNTRPTKSSPPACIIGCSVIADAYLEYSLLLLTSSLQLIGLELMPRPRLSASASKIINDFDESPSGLTFNERNSYSTILKCEFSDQGGLMALNGLPLQPKVVLPPGVGKATIVVNEDNLQFLGKVVQGVRESIREVYNACDFAQQRLVTQEEEFRQQQKVVQQTHEHVERKLDPKTQQQKDRQDMLASRQKKLMARADDILQKLMESRAPELSPAEEVWVQETARSEQAVKGFDERRQKVLTQYQILKRRMEEMQANLNSAVAGTAAGLVGPGSKKHYGTAQLKTVEDALGIESHLVDTTMKMVANLSSRLETLDIATTPMSGQESFH